MEEVVVVVVAVVGCVSGVECGAGRDRGYG